MRVENGNLVGKEEKRAEGYTVQNVDAGFDTGISTTIPNTRDTGAYLVVEVMFESSSNTANSALDMTVQGMTFGDYNYRDEDEVGTVTSQTGVDQFRLIETTSTTASDRHYARFAIYGDSVTVRPSVSQIDAAPGRSGAGRYLKHGYTDVTLDGSDNLRFAADGDVRAYISVFTVPSRNDIF